MVETCVVEVEEVVVELTIVEVVVVCEMTYVAAAKMISFVLSE